MIKEEGNGGRIAKNTVLLYIRMIFTMGIGLFTGREILRILGIEDYGIYNVIGGVVVMLSFLSNSLAGASQRFISFELGKKKDSDINAVVATSLAVHIILAIVLGCILECGGVWFLNTNMNIPPSRMYAANCVLQFSILTFMINIVSVPYNALIIAHEKMSAFAYISILEAILKLLVVYMLLVVNADKLIIYSFLQFVVGLIVRSCYTWYCKKSFNSISYKLKLDRLLYRKMFAFSGWNIIGNIGFSTKDQLSNIILNLFFGTTVNAARGVAGQVNGLLSAFTNNFGMALNPQIVKQYAAGNIGESRKYVYSGARLSFFLLTMVSIPILINIDYLLSIWLDKVPDYTSKFIPLVFLPSLLYSLSGTCSCAIQATGNVKKMMVGVCVILLAETPLAYVILCLGGEPFEALYPALFTNLLACLFRFSVLKEIVDGYYWKDFLFHVVLRCIFVFTLCLLVGLFIHRFLCSSLIDIIISILLSTVSSGLLIYLIGFSSLEKSFVKNKIFNRL